jgi:hypothetical protein
MEQISMFLFIHLEAPVRVSLPPPLENSITAA